MVLEAARTCPFFRICYIMALPVVQEVYVYCTNSYELVQTSAIFGRFGVV